MISLVISFVLTCLVDQNESQKDFIYDKELKFWHNFNLMSRSVETYRARSCKLFKFNVSCVCQRSSSEAFLIMLCRMNKLIKFARSLSFSHAARD